MGILKGVRNSDEVLSEFPMSSFCQDNNLDVDGNCLDPMSSVGNQPVYAHQIRLDTLETLGGALKVPQSLAYKHLLLCNTQSSTMECASRGQPSSPRMECA